MGGMVSNAINQSGLPNAINQAGFQQQLGRVSNQMYQPPNQMGGYDPYTAMRRPNYMPFGPNQQFYQPIYQPSYSQFSNFGYGQAPFGGFYQPPMMGMMGRGRGLQMGGQRMGMANPNMFTNYGDFDPRFRPQQSSPQQPNMFGGQATYLTEPRAMHHGMLGGAPIDYELPTGPEATFQPMRSPQPVQSQYRPIPFMNQSQMDARNAAVAAAAAPPQNIYDSGGGGDGGFGGGGGGGGGGVGMGADSTGEGVFKKGGNVDDGIASLLKK